MNEKRSDQTKGPGGENDPGLRVGAGLEGAPDSRKAAGGAGDSGRSSNDCRRMGDRIQALADGSLDPDQAKEVRAHCDACPDCGRALAEAEELWTLLSRDPDPVLPKRVWPLVHERLHPARPLRSRLSWAATAGFAAVAGLMLGLYLGPDNGGGRETWEQATWGEVGSLLADGSGLDNIYLDVSTDETAEVAQP